MRTTSSSTSVECTGVHDSLYGSVGGHIGPSASAFTVERSDIVINPIDEDGWRMPSPYSVTAYGGATIGSTWSSALTVWNSRNGYWYVQRTFTCAEGGAYSWHHRQPVKIDPSDLDAHLPSLSAADASVVKARNNLADRKASFAESLLEGRQSISYMSGRSGQLLEFVRAAARRDPRRMARALGLSPKSRAAKKAYRRFKLREPAHAKSLNRGQRAEFSKAGVNNISSAWLEYWFAISPIVADLGAIAAFIGEGAETQKYRVKGAGFHGLDQVITSSFHSEGVRYIEPYVTYTVVKTYEPSCYTSLWYTIDSSDMRRMTRFGFTDLPQALWAVVPWSFAVDWVLPVSEVLRSLSATQGLTFKGGSTTRIVKAVAEGNPQIHDPYENDPDRYNDHSFDFSGGVAKGFRMERSVYAPNEEPNPVTSWIKDPLDAWKATTILALLGSILLQTKR